MCAGPARLWLSGAAIVYGVQPSSVDSGRFTVSSLHTGTASLTTRTPILSCKRGILFGPCGWTGSEKCSQKSEATCGRRN